MEEILNLPIEETEREDVRGQEEARVEALRARLLTAQARAAALALGVPAERAKYAVRLAELAGIDAEAEDAEARVEEAVKRVIEDLPELAGAGAPGGSTGSAGAFLRAGAARDGFERGFLA